jgi:pyruvate dehydrogenase kinase 2/3/4
MPRSGSEPQGLTQPLPTSRKKGQSLDSRSMSLSMSMASKAMKLKLDGKLSREITERKQVGDMEDMLSKEGNNDAWWKNVGMDEGI